MQTDLLKVTGMACGGCTNSITRALKAVSGVHDAEVILATGETTVRYDAILISSDRFKSAVTDAGFGLDAGGGTHRDKIKWLLWLNAPTAHAAGCLAPPPTNASFHSNNCIRRTP